MHIRLACGLALLALACDPAERAADTAAPNDAETSRPHSPEPVPPEVAPPAGETQTRTPPSEPTKTAPPSARTEASPEGPTCDMQLEALTRAVAEANHCEVDRDCRRSPVGCVQGACGDGVHRDAHEDLRRDAQAYADACEMECRPPVCLAVGRFRCEAGTCVHRRN